MKTDKYNIQTTLRKLIAEQAQSSNVTDNAPNSAVDSPFTPAEEKFLGKFDAYGTKHLGIYILHLILEYENLLQEAVLT
jgi:hypothetical protein